MKDHNYLFLFMINIFITKKNAYFLVTCGFPWTQTTVQHPVYSTAHVKGNAVDDNHDGLREISDRNCDHTVWHMIMTFSFFFCIKLFLFFFCIKKKVWQCVQPLKLSTTVLKCGLSTTKVFTCGFLLAKFHNEHKWSKVHASWTYGLFYFYMREGHTLICALLWH